jgi:hypothetical protein
MLLAVSIMAFLSVREQKVGHAANVHCLKNVNVFLLPEPCTVRTSHLAAVFQELPRLPDQVGQSLGKEKVLQNKE